MIVRVKENRVSKIREKREFLTALIKIKHHIKKEQ